MQLFRIDRQRLWDRVIKFARWQHPAAKRGARFAVHATEGGLRLSRRGYLVLRRGGLSVRRRSPTQALTGASVE